MKRFFNLLVVLTIAAAIVPFSFAEASEAATPRPAYAGIIVKFKPGAATALGVAALHAKPLRPGSDSYTVPLGKDPDAQLESIKVDPRVEWAEPDYIMTTLYTSAPNDPYFNETNTWSYTGSPAQTLEHGRSWWERGYGSVNADAVWPYLESYPLQDYGARASADSIPVAVIDSGFYLTHPDIGSNVIVGKDCFDTYSSATGVTTTDYDVTPDSPTAPGNNLFIASHGTCVAGEIGAATNNGVGVAGVSYDQLVRVYKVQGIWLEGDATHLPGSSLILMSAVIDAIYQATDDGCKVINMSLGQPSPSLALQNAINYAHSQGVVVVAATGNDGTDSVWYPGAGNFVIGVGSYYVPSNATPAVSYSRSIFTNWGTGLDVLAPGDMVWGLCKPDWDYDGADTAFRPGYYWWRGTSMASPIVAGGIAALWRFAPTLSNDEIAGVAIQSAHDMGAAGYDTAYGWGAFDLQTARQALVSQYPELPAPTITSRPSDPTNASAGSVQWSAVAGYNVSYDVTFDGVTANTAGTSFDLGSLTEGVHQVRVTARSDRNWWNETDSSTAFSFTVDSGVPIVTPPPVPLLTPVYRFYRPSTGTHFYTADAAEMARVRDTMQSTYSLDGVCYYVNSTNPSNSAPLYRFYNNRTGTHLYTADENEKANILANLSGTYSLDGVAYYVSRSGGLEVHRFYSPGRGVHFYSADPNEIASVKANLGAVWQYEGPAYYVGQ